MFYSPEYHNALDKLRRFGLARDRVADRTPRQVVLTDDEAVSVLDVLSQYDREVESMNAAKEDKR